MNDKWLIKLLEDNGLVIFAVYCIVVFLGVIMVSLYSALLGFFSFLAAVVGGFGLITLVATVKNW